MKVFYMLIYILKWDKLARAITCDKSMKYLIFKLNIQIKLFLKITIFRINHKINNIAHAFAKVNEAQQITAFLSILWIIYWMT